MSASEQTAGVGLRASTKMAKDANSLVTLSRALGKKINQNTLFWGSLASGLGVSALGMIHHFGAAIALNTLVASAALIASPSIAATSTTNMGVSVSVQNTCNVAANPVAFGTYDPNSSTPTDAAANILVTCSLGTAYNVGLNGGVGTASSVAARKLTYGQNELEYALYRDSSRTAVWGDTPAEGVSGTYNVAQPPLTVYGRIANGQRVPTGNYADTVTVTVTY